MELNFARCCTILYVCVCNAECHYKVVDFIKFMKLKESLCQFEIHKYQLNFIMEFFLYFIYFVVVAAVLLSESEKFC